MTTTTEAITLRGQRVTRDDVLAALALHDELGRVAFLRRTGFRDSVRFVVRHGGRSYPSKAVLGCAAGLGPADFFGGAAHTGRQLTALGFQVRDAESGQVADRQLDSLRRRCEREGLEVAEKAWPELALDPIAYFASGSSRPDEIRGLARAGADIGVTAPELSPRAIAELEATAGSDVLTFCDSGAFSEVRIDADGVHVVKPLGPDHWARTFATYNRLGAALGSSAWLVAPDRVGCQDTSLERLARYRDQVAQVAATGARILVPIQKGERSQADFARAAAAALGSSDWVASLPCKKAATTPEELADFVRDFAPKHVHLLGLGIRSRALPRYLEALEGTGVSVSLDSCWLAQNAGRSNGPKGGPRRLTAARDVARDILSRLGVSSVATTTLAVYACLAGSGLVR